MDISSRFSLVDFLAYFFPGIFGTIGIYVLLLLTPLQNALTLVKVDLAIGVLLLALCYVIGVILSGFSEIVVKKFGSRFKVKASLLVPGFEERIIVYFNDFIGIDDKKGEWSLADFYICRSIVLDVMPNAAQMIQRQSSLRQLRLNLIPTIVIWFFAGVGWGIHLINSWGTPLMIASFLISMITIVTLLERMQSNEAREVREVLTAFIAGYKAGLFQKD